MAFASMFIIFLVTVLAFVAASTLIGIILLVVSHHSKKKHLLQQAEYGEEHKSYSYKVTKFFGIVFMVPLTLIVIMSICVVIYGAVSKRTQLSYSVFTYDLPHTERLLSHGVEPDCTPNSNRHAENGEDTLLYILVKDVSFGRDYNIERYYDESASSEDRLRMAQLLID